LRVAEGKRFDCVASAPQPCQVWLRFRDHPRGAALPLL